MKVTMLPTDKKANNARVCININPSGSVSDITKKNRLLQIDKLRNEKISDLSNALNSIELALFFNRITTHISH